MRWWWREPHARRKQLARYIKGSNSRAGDNFGLYSAAYGDTIVVTCVQGEPGLLEDGGSYAPNIIESWLSPRADGVDVY